MSTKLLQLPDEELKKKIWSEIGLNKQKIKESVEILKKWMQQQPHLPEDYDDLRLERTLVNCKNSMEKTKATIDLYYTIKNLCPDLMSGWDINDEWAQNAYRGTFGYPSQGLTPDGDRVIVMSFTKDTDHYDLLPKGKLCIMFTELRQEEDYCRSIIVVVDLKYINTAHVSMFTLPMLKKLHVVLLKAYKQRIKALHFLNVPSYAHIVINLMKSMVKTKIASRIQVHGSDLTELHKQVPKKILPSDFGGEEGSIAENMERWEREFKSKREWFLERERIKSDESKRPGRAMNSGDIFGFDGTFRKLDVD